MIAGEPRVSVVVATRDRPHELARCVESILRCEHEAFELIVVDQSKRPEEVRSDRRPVVIRTGTTGKSAALNLGIREARAPILLFTDDDCTVPIEWVGLAASLLARHPDVSMVFGDLVPVDHDSSQFFVPQTRWQEFRIVRGKRSAFMRGGAGANVVVRRELFDLIGLWDQFIGPGSRFKACEEWDLYYRALAGGAGVALAPELAVIHHGARPYADLSAHKLRWGYSFGEGAVIGKHLKLRDFGMVYVGGRILMQDIRQVVGHLCRRRRPPLKSIALRYCGVFAGLLHDVDPVQRMFS